MKTVFKQGQRVTHKAFGDGTYLFPSEKEINVYVLFDKHPNGSERGNSVIVSIDSLSPIRQSEVVELVKFGNASIQVADDPSEGIHSIALLTDLGMEYKVVSPELYHLLVKELSSQKGHVHEE